MMMKGGAEKMRAWVQLIATAIEDRRWGRGVAGKVGKVRYVRVMLV